MVLHSGRSVGARLAMGIVAAVVAVASNPPVVVGQGLTRPPNVVLVFVDDMGYGDLSSYGHPTIRTPRLDRMAEQGVRLTSFYVASPACSASRAALLTGRYPVRTGIDWVLSPKSTNGLRESELTLAEGLKARGYRTAAIGKWHLGHLPEHLPTEHGFDSFFGIPYSNDMDKAIRNDPPVPLIRGKEVVEQPIDQSTMTRRFTDEAIRIIRETRDRPFFIYLAHPMPHLPLHASPEFRGRSRGGLYGDVIEEIDANTGRILDTLDELGLAENTIVIFASDNGPWVKFPPTYPELYGTTPGHVGTAGHLRGYKGTTYEGGMRVPGIIRWPAAIPGGREPADVVSSMDLYVTLLTVAGAPVPSHHPVDGIDVMPLLRGEPWAREKPFFYFRRTRLEAVRDGRWKLRLPDPEDEPADPSPQLFDLEVDPGERYNLAEDHPEVVERLRKTVQSSEFRVQSSEFRVQSFRGLGATGARGQLRAHSEL